MRVYADNDFIHKLACCDLVDHFLSAMGITAADLRVLSSARFKFNLHKPERGRQRLGVPVFERIRDVIYSATEILDAPNVADLQAVTGIRDIDAGELLLASFASRDSGSYLATGDKRFLIALSNAESGAATSNLLSGRVLCLEAAMRRLIRHLGFQGVRARVVPGMECDTALRVAFGSGIDAVEGTVLEALDEYVVELRRLTKTLLVIE